MFSDLMISDEMSCAVCPASTDSRTTALEALTMFDTFILVILNEYE